MELFRIILENCRKSRNFCGLGIVDFWVKMCKMWGICGILWDFFGFCGILRYFAVFSGILQDFAGFCGNGILWEFAGNLWDLREIMWEKFCLRIHVILAELCEGCAWP